MPLTVLMKSRLLPRETFMGLSIWIFKTYLDAIFGDLRIDPWRIRPCKLPGIALLSFYFNGQLCFVHFLLVNGRLCIYWATRYQDGENGCIQLSISPSFDLRDSATALAEGLGFTKKHIRESLKRLKKM